MKMVVASADLQGIHLMLACDSADIGPESRFKVGFDPRDAVFRAEDYVIVKRRVCVGHRESPLT